MSTIEATTDVNSPASLVDEHWARSEDSLETVPEPSPDQPEKPPVDPPPIDPDDPLHPVPDPAPAPEPSPGPWPQPVPPDTPGPGSGEDDPSGF